MKDLHNHIFSNTTCISKETMLRYINKQLPKEELHQVETHMLDCELCTDAYEGLAYAENASMLFAIDSQIDKRVRSGAAKAPIMRNLMVAASVLAIVFGTYFTFNFFNNTINNESNIALNEDKKSNQQIQLESIMPHSTDGVDLEGMELKNELNKKGDRELATASAPVVVVAEKRIVEDEEILEDDEALMVADIEIFSADEVEDVEKEKGITVIAESERMVVLTESLTETKFASGESPMVEKYEVVKTKSANKKALKKRKKNLSLRSISSPTITTEVTLKSEKKEGNNSEQKILIIEGYKFVNYLKEYQEVYDKEKGLSPVTNSVSAGYANKLDEESAEKAKEEITVEVTYKETLEEAIHLYKNKKYRAALSEFDNILAKHPKDVNAQFYSGLCYYHLAQYNVAIKKFNTILKNKETEFNEETNWYKALTLINMRDITSAKKLLNKIIEKDGFYEAKAREKLKEL